jgi:hypothetical protein
MLNTAATIISENTRLNVIAVSAFHGLARNTNGLQVSCAFTSSNKAHTEGGSRTPYGRKVMMDGIGQLTEGDFVFPLAN